MSRKKFFSCDLAKRDIKAERDDEEKSFPPPFFAAPVKEEMDHSLLLQSPRLYYDLQLLSCTFYKWLCCYQHHRGSLSCRDVLPLPPQFASGKLSCGVICNHPPRLPFFRGLGGRGWWLEDPSSSVLFFLLLLPPPRY